MSARPLYSVEAEQSVLGALLLNNDAYDSIADIIGEADFWAQTHRVIWRHIAALLSSGKPADATTLIASMTAQLDLGAAGGVEYVGEILTQVPSSRGIVQYARLVVDHRIERDLAAAADTMADLASATGPVSDRLDAAQKLILGLSETSTEGDPREIGDVLHSFVEDLEARMERGGEISGMPTGLKDLDEKLDGLQDGDLIIVGGRPSMGKTSLAAQIADDNAMAGKSVLVFSFEMAAAQWAQRSISRIGRVDSHKLRSGQLGSDEFERISSAIGRLHHRKLVIDDRAGITVDRMRARARRVKRKHGLDLIVIDYLQLMTADSGDNRNEQISGITRALKLLARELGVPVVLLSHLSRKCEERTDKRPMMADLRDSGAIEQDADVIIFVYRDEVYHPDSPDKGMAELLIRKNRMGAIGDVRATWLGEYTTFENYTGTYTPRAIESKPRARKSTFDD
ncbi:MAG TPA: replicative DNA helicase [Burkholderiaceae bacterium]|nr:replicative DNA helicase [Burkholderiaceae bacterium]